MGRTNHVLLSEAKPHHRCSTPCLIEQAMTRMLAWLQARPGPGIWREHIGSELTVRPVCIQLGWPELNRIEARSSPGPGTDALGTHSAGMCYLTADNLAEWEHMAFAVPAALLHDALAALSGLHRRRWWDPRAIHRMGKSVVVQLHQSPVHRFMRPIIRHLVGERWTPTFAALVKQCTIPTHNIYGNPSQVPL